MLILQDCDIFKLFLTNKIRSKTSFLFYPKLWYSSNRLTAFIQQWC